MLPPRQPDHADEPARSRQDPRRRLRQVRQHQLFEPDLVDGPRGVGDRAVRPHEHGRLAIGGGRADDAVHAVDVPTLGPRTDQRLVAGEQSSTGPRTCTRESESTIR